MEPRFAHDHPMSRRMLFEELTAVIEMWEASERQDECRKNEKGAKLKLCSDIQMIAFATC